MMALCGCVASGCSNAMIAQSNHAPPEGVSIGYIRWDRSREQQEITQVLTTNGISVELWGSLTYSISVPSKQAQKATALLQTNHLAIERIIVLHPTEVSKTERAAKAAKQSNLHGFEKP